MTLGFDPATESQNMDQLRLLGVLFMIKALLELAVMLILILFVCGIGGVLGLIAKQANHPAPLLGLAAMLPVLLALAGLLPLTILDFIAARSLPRCRRHTLCVAASIIACLSFPLGTVLGVFAMIVLVKSSVKGMFARA